jgi:hypothetical protein
LYWEHSHDPELGEGTPLGREGAREGVAIQSSAITQKINFPNGVSSIHTLHIILIIENNTDASELMPRKKAVAESSVTIQKK